MNPRYPNAIAEYQEGNTSLVKLCKKHKITRTRFSRYMQAQGIKVINHQNALKFNNKVFDIIDSEEKAYWLGFIYADGYVALIRNTFEVSLALSEVEHLNKLAKFFDYTDNVKTDHFRCRFSVTDKHLKDTLVKLGCVPQKSLILQYPTLEPELHKHFIRGYFDGDGCISIVNNRSKPYPQLSLSLIGTTDMLTNIIKYSQVKAKPYLSRKNQSLLCRTFSLGIKKGMKFMDFMYKDSTIYLQRKYDKYLLCRSNSKWLELLSRN